MVILVMGVSGSGKTTVGERLADVLGVDFLDADAFHSEANRQKMESGVPLDDADRAPWLAALVAAIDQRLAAGRSAVLACSALKQRYRDALMGGSGQVRLVYLKGSFELLRERLEERVGHDMKAEMLESQLAELEEPPGAITIDAAAPLEQQVAEIIAAVAAVAAVTPTLAG
jgi:gluconokinase